MTGEDEREDALASMKLRYRRLMSAGLVMLLLAFAIVILKPFGVYSLWVALLLFASSMLPLELARRSARTLALLMLRNEESVYGRKRDGARGEKGVGNRGGNRKA